MDEKHAGAPFPFKELEEALRKESLQDKIFAVLMTLAIEYEAKAITQDRFASRVIESLTQYAKAGRSLQAADTDKA